MQSAKRMTEALHATAWGRRVPWDEEKGAMAGSLDAFPVFGESFLPSCPWLVFPVSAWNRDVKYCRDAKRPTLLR